MMTAFLSGTRPTRDCLAVTWPCISRKNVWSDGRGTIITTEGLYGRNFPAPPDDVRQRLLSGLGAETLIVVPPLRMEGTGHVDVFAKLATPNTVLVTEPRSIINGERG